MLEEPSSLASDSALGLVFVAGWVDSTRTLLVLSSESGEVVGSITSGGCLQGSFGASDLVYDSVNGLLYAAGCGMLLVLNPSDGALVANPTLQVYVNTSFAGCDGWVPETAGMTVDPSSGRVFALVAGCSNESQPFSVDVVNATTNDITSILLPLPTNPQVEFDWQGLMSSEPLAFDQSNGLLYVADSVSSSSPFGWLGVNVTLLDPRTGLISGSVVTPRLYSAAPVLLAYDSNSRHVYSLGVSNLTFANASMPGSLNQSIFQLPPSSGGNEVSLYNWSTPCYWEWTVRNLTGQSVCAKETPGWITYDPDGPTTLVVALFGNATNVTTANQHATLWSFSPDSSRILVSTNFGKDDGPVTIDSETDSLVMLDDLNANVWVANATSLAVRGSGPLDYMPGAATIDPGTGTLYVGDESLACFNLVVQDIPCAASVAAIPDSTDRPEATWETPTGTYLGWLGVNELNGNLEAYLSCDRIVACLSGGLYAEIATYSAQGAILSAAAALAENHTCAVPTQVSTVNDRTGDPLLVFGGGSGGGAVELNATTGGIVAGINVCVAPSPHSTLRFSDFTYDSTDNVVYASDSQLNVSTHRYDYGLRAFNGSTFVAEPAPSAGPLATSATAFDVAFDSLNDTLIIANGTVTEFLRASTGAVEGVSTSGPIASLGSGLLVFDPNNGVAYEGGAGNISEVQLATGTVVAAYPAPGIDFLLVDPRTGTADCLLSGGAIEFVPGPGPLRYPVTFEETGLPAGVSWSVTLNGTSSHATAARIPFLEEDGTFDFTVLSVPGFAPDPARGVTVVDGAAVDVAITFNATAPGCYTVLFLETGLPAGANWSVTLNGVQENSLGPRIAFPERNGSAEPFVVNVGPGYVARPAAGNVTVAGKSIFVPISVSPTPSSPSAPLFLGLPGDTGYFLLGGVVAASVAGGALALWRRGRR
jgi:hypothetical protein